MNESEDNYTKIYEDGGIYEDSMYGGPYISRGVKFARFMKNHIKENSKVICIGCGNGFEVLEYLNQGHDAYGTELHSIENVKPLEGRIIKAKVPELPFKDKEFNVLHCTEVLEHIETEETDAFLQECKRVSEIQVLSIATEMDSYNTHINLQTPGWWLDRLNKNGFDILTFQYKPCVSNSHADGSVDVLYKDGLFTVCKSR